MVGGPSHSKKRRGREVNTLTIGEPLSRRQLKSQVWEIRRSLLEARLSPPKEKVAPIIFTKEDARGVA